MSVPRARACRYRSERAMLHESSLHPLPNAERPLARAPQQFIARRGRSIRRHSGQDRHQDAPRAAVGRDYDWTSRQKLSHAELAALLNDLRLEVHVLMVDGVPAGFAELDRRIDGVIELLRFGLMPEFIGQGLGIYFLHWTIDKAW